MLTVTGMVSIIKHERHMILIEAEGDTLFKGIVQPLKRGVMDGIRPLNTPHFRIF
jgi:hypothetical protein